MSPIERKHADVIDAMMGDFASAAGKLANLDARKDELPPAYYQTQRAELVRLAQVADRDVRQGIDEYAVAVSEEAARIRAAADSDPAARVTALQERKLLADSPTDAAVIVQQAEQMLSAGQPQRAAILLAAAGDKGQTLPLNAHALGQAIDRALDDAIPGRKAAADLERTGSEALAKLHAGRLTALADTLGLNPDGSAGNGTAADRGGAEAMSTLVSFLNKGGGEA